MFSGFSKVVEAFFRESAFREYEIIDAAASLERFLRNGDALLVAEHLHLRVLP